MSLVIQLLLLLLILLKEGWPGRLVHVLQQGYATELHYKRQDEEEKNFNNMVYLITAGGISW